MKSTKIEDILADEIEEASEQNVNEIKNDDFDNDNDHDHNDDVQGELRDQLENLKSELSMMKKDTIPESNVNPTIQPTDNIKNVEAHKTMEREVGTLEKLLKFDKVDVKQTLIISLLYVITNSVYINEMIDNMIPYSLYSYTFAIKLILIIITFRLLNLIDF